MSNKNPAPAAFETTERVLVSLPETPVLAGFVAAKTGTGWLIIQLDPASVALLEGDKRMKDGKISCRARSLSAAPLASIEDRGPEGDQLDDDTDDLPDDVEADEQDEEAGQTAASKMAETLRAARVRYTKTKRPLGSASADCGDQIARFLRDFEPLEVAAIANKVLVLAPGSLEEKYAHLNPGQIRMNSGNRIRGYWKTINEDGNEAEIARVAPLLGLADEEGPCDDDSEGDDE